MSTSLLHHSLFSVVFVLLLLHLPCGSSFSLSVYNDSTCSTPLPALSFSSPSQNFTNAGGSITYPCAQLSAALAPGTKANYSCVQDTEYPNIARLQVFFVNSNNCTVDRSSTLEYYIFGQQFILNASNCAPIGKHRNPSSHV